MRLVFAKPTWSDWWTLAMVAALFLVMFGCTSPQRAWTGRAVKGLAKHVIIEHYIEDNNAPNDESKRYAD